MKQTKLQSRKGEKRRGRVKTVRGGMKAVEGARNEEE